MASLGTITFGEQDEGNSTVDTDVGTPPMESISGVSESTYIHTNNNNSTDEVSYTPLGNTPADFGTMDSLSYQLRYLRSANGANKTWDSLRIQIFQSDRSTVLTDEMTVASSITTTSATSSSVVAFTAVVESTKTLWDGAVVAIWFYKTRSKGGTSDDFRVIAGEVTGTYSAGVTVVFGAATLTGAGSLSTSGTRTTFEAATLTGTGSIAVSGKRNRFAAANLSGDGAISVSGTRTTFEGATLSGAGSLSASGDVTTPGGEHFGVATLTGTGSTSVSGTRTTFESATLAGTGSMSVAGFRTRLGTVTLLGTGSLSASGEVGEVMSGVVFGIVTLTATGTLRALGIPDSNEPPVDPFDADGIIRRGRWFRKNGRVLFMTGGKRGAFEGLRDWDRISPLISVNADRKQEHEKYIYYDIRKRPNDSVAATKAAIIVLITGLWPFTEQ